MFLADILERDRNAFDLVRLIAALAVIFGHSFYLLPSDGYHDPVMFLTNRHFSGSLAVATFFFLSGILVSQSFLSRSPVQFAVMRASRIYPGALVCLLILTFVMGPIVSTLSAREYFASPEPYRYLRDTWSFIRLGPWPSFGDATAGTLPGVFTTNLYRGVINGSLWTLPPELACYAWVFGVGVLGILGRRWAVNAAAVVLIAMHFIAPWALPYFWEPVFTNDNMVACWFLAGVVAFANRDWIVLRWDVAAVLVVLALPTNRTAVADYFLFAALFYGLLKVASTERARAIRLSGDYSFGIYIYGAAIQQIIGHYFPTITSWPSNLLALPAALLLGYLSWTLVERPALVLARRLVGRPSSP